MILVDTSVWVEHLRRRDTLLAARLEAGDVMCHPYVIGEIGLGSLRRRADVLELLASLPSAPVVGHDDVMLFVEQRGLSGRGIGWIDVHLAASAVVSGAKLWTTDRRLADVARSLRLAPE